MSYILLPDGTKVNPGDETGTFEGIFPIYYYDFAKINNIEEVGTDTINRWVNDLKERYEKEESLEGIKRFFTINTDKYDSDIENRNYKITILAVSHDTKERVLILKVFLSINTKKEE